jgi:membrane associated rhomboid family serine protease
VRVAAADAGRAQSALAAYDEEAGGEPDAAVADAASPRLGWTVGIVLGAGLLAFFAVTGPPAPGSRWFARGAAAAGHMLSGEPWRAVTALTLHVDMVHVAGNAVATAVLLPPLVQRLGPGVGVWLMLLAGTGANLLAAMVHDPRHVAVGASTATFGAIGGLAGLQLLPAPTVAKAPARTRWRPWVVFAASLVLLGMLGTGRGADVLGHALGLLVGGLLGAAAGATCRRPLGPALQWSLVTLAGLALIGCWRLALA